jgi:hypothetical protein
MFNYFPFEISFFHFLSMVQVLGFCFQVSSMIFQGACVGKTSKPIKVAPRVIMVKARDSIQKGNNTTPKEI